MYYTIRPKKENWIKWFKMMRELKGHYSMRDFAHNTLYSPSFVSEILNGYREPNARYIATSCKITGLLMDDLFIVEEIHKVLNDERIPRRMRGQTEKII